MSDKPLDCVGIDASRTDLGKSDFIPCPESPILYGEGKRHVVGQPEPVESPKHREGE